MDSVAKVIDRIGNHGIRGLQNAILYRKEVANDEPLVMVRKVNCTPEPDGSFKVYFKRVPPDINTVLQAVAWEFEREPDYYQPLIET
mgnify:CR=1 FL=1